MNKTLKAFFILLASCLITSNGWSAEDDHAGDGHGHEKSGQAQHDGEHEGGLIQLTPEQIRQASLQIITVEPSSRAETIKAPGVVRFNEYKIADVTSLIDAVVDSRHVRLGEVVFKGAPLMTLKSTSLAQTEADWLRSQAEYQKNHQEIERLTPLAAEGIVSQARLQQSQSAFETARAQQLAARATLVSYGLSDDDMVGLESGKSFGLVTLRAAIDGTVVSDDAVLGQHIAAGSRLMRIVDEDTVWVEVNLSPAQLQRIKSGTVASVVSKGQEGYFQAKVVGIHHEFDATTRTAIVRLEVDNRTDRLHTGMFVDAEISVGNAEMALLVPETAIQRQGNEHIVFVEEKPGHFERREVEIESASMGNVVILSGLKAGEHIVAQGSFSLLSELLKSGFEAHNH